MYFKHNEMSSPKTTVNNTARTQSFGTTQTSAAVCGLVHSRYKRDGRMAVYRQLYSADGSVMPSVNRPETLPFTT
jgi:hypothetical protein